MKFRPHINVHESSLHHSVAYLVTLPCTPQRWRYLENRERERERDVPMQSSVSMNQCSREKGGNIRRSIFTETSDVVQIPEMPINSLPHARSVQNFGDYEVYI